MDETYAHNVREAMREAASEFLDSDAGDMNIQEITYTLAAGFRDLDTGTVLTKDGERAFTDDANRCKENDGPVS